MTDQFNPNEDYEPVPFDQANNATYIRRSTFQQENEHQIQAIENWLNKRDLELSDVQIFSETASGASRNRDELKKLIEKIQDGEIDHIVIWELSRVAREGELAQRFFNICEENNVHVHITGGSIKEIKPDGSNRFVADILTAVYAEERRTLIRRTKYGRERARKAGKWMTKPPLGFTTDEDGYLITNIEAYDEDFNENRDSFWDIKNAIENIEYNDSSYRSEAMDLETTRQSLSRIYNDNDKRDIYLELDSDDKRVDSALDIIRQHQDQESMLATE